MRIAPKVLSRQKPPTTFAPYRAVTHLRPPQPLATIIIVTIILGIVAIMEFSTVACKHVNL